MTALASFPHCTAAATGGDDRVFFGTLADGTLLAILADGATGVGLGSLAADAFVASVRRQVTAWTEDLSPVLRRADRDIAALGKRQRASRPVLPACQALRPKEKPRRSVGRGVVWCE